MRLSRKSEYALLALIDLAQHSDEGYVRIRDICARKTIPRKFLEQILLSLKRSGHVHSVRGARGGYRLARSPQKVTLAEIIRLIDGPLAPVQSVSRYFYEQTPIQNERRLLHVFKEIRDFAARKLERTKLADVI